MSLKSQFLHSVRTPILTTTFAYIMLSLMICTRGGKTPKIRHENDSLKSCRSGNPTKLAKSVFSQGEKTFEK